MFLKKIGTELSLGEATYYRPEDKEGLRAMLISFQPSHHSIKER